MRWRLAGRLAALALGCGAVGYCAGLAYGDAAPAQRIALTARKFDFSTPEIRVKKGERVTLVLTTTDFVHGFSVPDLQARIDLIPGRTVELSVRPDRAGRFIFLCDNFCGEGHDTMSGVLVVTED